MTDFNQNQGYNAAGYNPAPQQGGPQHPDYGFGGVGANGIPTGDASQNAQAAAQAASDKAQAKAYEKAQRQQAKAQKKAQKKAQRANRPKAPLLPSFFSGAAGAIVVLLVAALVFNFVPGLKSSGSGASVQGGNITIENTEDMTVAQAVAAKCLPSTVTIYVYSNGSSGWNEYFGGGSDSSQPNALGSGVVIESNDNESFILTNYHVVEGISKATVTVGDESYPATQVGYDSATDLAVIKIAKGGLTPMEWGDSSGLQVGEWVMAIGSPYGYEQTCTTGIVSAMYRSNTLADSTGMGYTTYTDMIQTDAAINPGNSGGALVDAEGKLIGINTYISSSSESSAGLGFAIPATTAKSVSDQLIAGKKVQHAFLGVGLKDSTDPAGAYVSSVEAGSAAQEAGIQPGDVITKFGDATISSSDDLSAAVTRSKVGDKVQITLVRNGTTQTVMAVLGDKASAASSQDNDSSQGNGSNQGNGSDRDYGFGFGLEDLFGSGGESSGGAGSFWD